VPQHLALVVDCPPHAAPSGGVEALRLAIAGCLESGVRWLSIRLPAPHNGSSGAGAALLQAWQQYVRSEMATLAKQGVWLAPYPCASADGSGTWGHCHNGVQGAARSLFRALNAARQTRLAGERLRVYLGVGCGGREELVSALRRLASDAAAGRLDSSAIMASDLQECLATRALPPVDLLVRTGGTGRISDFLLWQAAYAELLFMDVPWAQFRRSHFEIALADYAQRQRRFGGLPTA
jgi:undecaprenyl diphosphate synthase